MRRLALLPLLSLGLLALPACQDATAPDVGGIDSPTLGLRPDLALTTSTTGIPIVDLGFFPGGDESFAFSVNDKGEVTGYSNSPTSPIGQPFLWTAKDGMVDLGLPAGHFLGWGHDINKKGVIVGNGGGVPWKGWIRDKYGNYTIVPLPEGWGRSAAYGINDKGAIVGAAHNESGLFRAYLWTEKDGTRNLGTMGGPTSGARDINNRGQVVGTAGFNPSVPLARHAFLWTERYGMMDLGTLPGTDPNNEWVHAWGINDHGLVAGWSLNLTTFAYRAYRWSAGSGMVELDALPGHDMAYARDIDRDGDVVGSSWLGGGPGSERAVVWRLNGDIVDLGTLGGAYSQAWGINKKGQIVGASLGADGLLHAVMWIVDKR